MPRDTRPRRLTPPAGGRLPAPAPHPEATGRPLLSILAQTASRTDLLPALHQHALDATGGSCSLLFEHNPRNGILQATSAFGLEQLLTDPWVPGDPENALVAEAFRRREAMLVTDAARQVPDLRRRLGTPAVLLVPLAKADERVGLLAIGFAQAGPSPRAALDAPEIADVFLAALELSRLRQASEMQRDVRQLLDEFAIALGATLNLSGGLEIICQGANRLFAADRTAVWIHDRRARHLVLKASSDPEQLARGVRVNADDPLAPAAAAMRRTRAEILPASDDPPTRTVTVPLRGTRRALGTIVFDGVRVETGGELVLLDRADELGRQISSAIENMQLLEEVQRSRRELENTFDSITHLVVVFDRRGRIVHANEAFARRLALSRDQLLDRPIADCLGPELAAWLVDEDGAAPADGDAVRVREIADPVLNGPFMVTVSDLQNSERERVGSVVVARDLTPQSRLEAEREELRKRLTQSEKLAALGQFVAGIAHELNNPLQGVLGHLELLRVTGAFPKQLRPEVRTIYREADRAAKIVRNLLVFAGSRGLSRRSVSLPAVVQKVLALRHSAWRSLGIEVVRNYQEHLPRVQGDPLLLHQVFLNIVMNAEHAIAVTGKPGRIEIGAARTAARDRIVVTVRDTGEGIAADTLPRIFEPFYTTKEVGKGTGLGLAIAYGIVQEHGGQITAANHPGGGAVFTVELPVAGPRDANA